MSEGIQQALSLMAIGMITVAFILFLVLIVGNIIIRITNTIKVPEINKVIRATPGAIASNKMAAIVAAVGQVTQGRGRVSKVEKIN